MMWSKAKKDKGTGWTKTVLLSSTGHIIGDVEWHFSGGPYYPHFGDQRYGAYNSLEASKKKVEDEYGRARPSK